MPNNDTGIEITRKNGEIRHIEINGELLGLNGYNDRGTWFLPTEIIGNLSVNDLPQEVVFEICHFIEDDSVHRYDIPFTLQKVDSNKVRILFDDSRRRDQHSGTGLYMKAKRSVVEERASEMHDVSLENHFLEDDDEDWIHLAYSATVEAESIATAVQLAEQIEAEIEGAVEMRLSAVFWTPKNAKNEKDFTLRIVLPILRKIGFQNVKYNHGKREFGRDVLFARITEFQDIEFWGGQVKFGDISGGAGADIDAVIYQIDDAFKMPFYDLYTKQRLRISKFALIVSGKFTENAIEKICDKIESHAIRNNILFVDGEKLQTLAERFRVAQS